MSQPTPSQPPLLATLRPAPGQCAKMCRAPGTYQPPKEEGIGRTGAYKASISPLSTVPDAILLDVPVHIVQQRLSPARLAPYLATANRDLDQGLALYLWNTQMSAALFEGLQHAEVVLRNALSDQLAILRQNAGHPDGKWFWHDTDPWFNPWWQPEMLRLLKDACRKLEKRQRPLTTGGIVAELSFGFWRYLLTSHYVSSLWTPALRHAFPKGLDRDDARKLVEEINLLRNRIAHHEPIYRRDLETDAMRIEQLLDWLCPTTAQWALANNRVADLWAQKPDA